MKAQSPPAKLAVAPEAPAPSAPAEPALPPAGPALPPGERARHIADAEAELSYAERALDESLRNPRPRSEPKKKPAVKAEESAPEPVTDTCSIACTALASMRRSADFLCRLAGPEDGRCAQARARVESARARVERAECRCSAS